MPRPYSSQPLKLKVTDLAPEAHALAAEFMLYPLFTPTFLLHLLLLSLFFLSFRALKAYFYISPSLIAVFFHSSIRLFIHLFTVIIIFHAVVCV